MRQSHSMRFSLSWSFLPALLVAFGLTAGAHASGTSPPPRQPPPPPPEVNPASPVAPADAAAKPGRVEAEKIYAKGWDMVQEAKKELAAGKTDSAKKRFGKALKKFDEAAQIDPSYYQTWNMVGFCSRKSGDLKRAFEAYQKCLSIEPEYAEAHEYLGEAYLMSGDRAKAKEQLAWLLSRKSEEAEELSEKIDAFEKGGAAAVEKASAAEKEDGDKKEEGKEKEEKAEK